MKNQKAKNQPSKHSNIGGQVNTTKLHPVMEPVVSLCKRRGFIFQSGEIYGGLRSFYDYGPLGVAMKRAIANLWWRDIVERRSDVVGLDSAIMTHPRVWEASGHLSGFSDPLVDCKNCKARFRPDIQPKVEPGSEVFYKRTVTKVIPPGSDNPPKTYREQVSAIAGPQGYVCPECGCPDLSDVRHFCGMFRTFLGAVDIIEEIEKIDDPVERAQLLAQHSVYLRPETAQGIFVQFANVQQTMGMKLPFGIAQQGKSFRNEIVVEHYIFRSCEFEQMEMEFFCEESEEDHWLEYWSRERLNWYRRYATRPDSFRLRAHEGDELAHYSKACHDVEFQFPWGWGELEGIAMRGDYDLKKHAEASGAKLTYFDPHKINPETEKPGMHVMPRVIEPAAGLTRAVLCFLVDAYRIEKNSDGKERHYLALHPAIAPYQVAVLPLLQRSEAQCAVAAQIADQFRSRGMRVSVDVRQSIGKRYARHDEIGTPFGITVDDQTLNDQTVTVRNRDTMKQDRLRVGQIVELVSLHIRGEATTSS